MREQKDESYYKEFLEVWQHELTQIIAQEVAHIVVQKLFAELEEDFVPWDEAVFAEYAENEKLEGDNDDT